MIKAITRVRIGFCTAIVLSILLTSTFFQLFVATRSPIFHVAQGLAALLLGLMIYLFVKKERSQTKDMSFVYIFLSCAAMILVASFLLPFMRG